MANLKYILYDRKELWGDGKMPPDICSLFRSAMEHDLVEIDISLMEKDSLWENLKERGIVPEDSLLITSSDDVLEEVKHLPLAVVAYRNPQNEQDLFEADFLVEGFEEVDFYFLERVYQRKHGIPWRVIDTRRCYLREMTMEDLPALFRLYEGKGITDYISPLYDWEDEAAYTKAYIENIYPYFGYGMWLVMDSKTHELIGRAGIHPNVAEDEYLLEMGYMIDVKYQGRGYATEVCKAILDYAKGADTGFERVYCFVQKGNEASLRLLRNLGFTFEREEIREGKEMLRFYMELA